MTETYTLHTIAGNMADDGFLQDHVELEIAVTSGGRIFDTMDRRALREMIELHLGEDGVLRGWGEGTSFLPDDSAALCSVRRGA